MVNFNTPLAAASLTVDSLSIIIKKIDAALNLTAGWNIFGKVIKSKYFGESEIKSIYSIMFFFKINWQECWIVTFLATLLKVLLKGLHNADI